ncbi:MAG: T9SS type A sorting domain-containing protein, partial [Calditrichales bacterium]
IRFDHAQWIDKAIIYQITPYTFVPNGDLQDIIKKIPELAVLGVNTLYLQPIYETYGGGQGYDILNYFRMRPDHGTTADLRQFITTARQYGMRIMLDFVPGHSSIHHRYAKNSVQYGTDSHYYNFYKRTRDNAPYSMHYNTHPQGFLYYFWTDLPMFDYDNPEVQRWMLEAAKFWLVNFDIDGYRIDAVWGVNARNPEWAKKLRRTLKSIKPEIFLLAEDKATWPATFDESFDAAYDWSASESWVSQWTWQWDYNPSANPTIFNYPSQGSRARMLREALTNYNNGYHPRAKILRFLENNDTQPFYLHHGQARTRMAAALLFALNGIPMMYNGQEIGHSTHPYSTYNIFESYASIRSLDTKLLFPYYQALIAIRNTYPSLSSENYREIPMSPSSAQFGFHRWLGQENIFVLINMANAPVTAQATLPVDRIEIDTLKTYYLTDMLSGEFLSVPGSELSNVSISLDAYHTRIFLLADSVLSVTPLPEKKIVSPGTFALEQNYPNPFNPRTTIAFSVPDPGNVSLKIYDILGQEVMVLLNQHKMAGDHKVEFDGSGLASGVYIYQLMYQKKNIQRKMVLLK